MGVFYPIIRKQIFLPNSPPFCFWGSIFYAQLRNAAWARRPTRKQTQIYQSKSYPFPSIDISTIFKKIMFLYNDLCPHHLCLSMLLGHIFRQKSHSTLKTWMPGRKNDLLPIIILDHSGDLFNQMLPGPAVWQLHDDAAVGPAFAVLSKIRAFKHFLNGFF